MKKNKFLTAALCAALAVSMAVPTLAGDPNQWYTYKAGARYIRGNLFEAPGWLWIRGNCYYITAPRGTDIFAKNTVTPDGYTVDEQGRWTVDGVVQTNNFGHEKFWEGKNINCTDAERWQQIKDGLRIIAADTWCDVDDNFGLDKLEAYRESTNTMIDFGGIKILYTPLSEDGTGQDYMLLELANFSDATTLDVATQAAQAASHFVRNEYAIKAVLGDNAGQEFFDYYMSLFREWTEEGYASVFDENGNYVMGRLTYPDLSKNERVFVEDPNGPDIKMEKTTITNRRIDLRNFDVSRFQNKKTDYGRNYSVQRRTDNAIWLTVY